MNDCVRTPEQCREYLDELAEANISSVIENMSDEDISELTEYVESILEQSEAGLNKMFESFSIVIKSSRFRQRLVSIGFSVTALAVKLLLASHAVNRKQYGLQSFYGYFTTAFFTDSVGPVTQLEQSRIDLINVL